MFSEATMDLNPSIHQPKDMFFLPVFAYLLLVFLMLALSCLNLTLFNPSLEEGISAHTLPLRTCCWPDPPFPGHLGSHHSGVLGCSFLQPSPSQQGQFSSHPWPSLSSYFIHSISSNGSGPQCFALLNSFLKRLFLSHLPPTTM